MRLIIDHNIVQNGRILIRRYVRLNVRSSFTPRNLRRDALKTRMIIVSSFPQSSYVYDIRETAYSTGTYTPTTPGNLPKKSLRTSLLYLTKQGMDGRKGVGPSFLYTLSISSALYTNSRSGRPTNPRKVTISPYISCSINVILAMSEIWY